MDENLLWQRDRQIAATARALEKNNFAVHIAADKNAALAQALDLILPAESVAFGGSFTVAQLGLIEALKKRNQKLLLQVPGMTPEEVLALRRQALAADVYIASPNAVTADGELVFVDKIGNRAAGMMFGPEKVIAIAGYNKIVESESAAFSRVEQIAGPVNARRLKAKTPCAVSGICSDCDSPDRICNIAVTLWKKPARTEYHVLLVADTLGY